VQYYAKEGADRALEAAQARDDRSAAVDRGAADSADPRAVRRAAAAAAVEASVREGGIKLGGRVLFLLRAVEKGVATRLTGGYEAGEQGATKKFDRRHTYLAYEGASAAY